MDKPVIAIVGRPNVGKSQLFNRLLGKPSAIVQDEPGITRDRIYSECTWDGRACYLVDTGGLDPQEDDVVKMLAQRQSRKAIEESTLLLFVVDAKEGLTHIDREISVELRKMKKPLILVANKVDNFESAYTVNEFAPLGFGEAFPVSALHGTNSGELLDEIFSRFPAPSGAPEAPPLRLTLAGRRNVGKSSLINALTDEERSIVHDAAGTTRDCVESLITLAGTQILVTDTSGLRRKGKIDEKVEYYSAIRTLRAIESSDCVLLVLNAEEGIVAQDKKVAEQIQKTRKASVIVVNKWDLMQDSPETNKKEFTIMVKKELYFIDYSPVLFISALHRKGIGRIIPEVNEVMKEYRKKIETSMVNRIFQEAQSLRPAPSYKGEQLRIFYAFQEGVAPPRFTLKVNSPKLVHFSYKRYLENTVRKALGFIGSPVVITFKKK
ncbi:MAG: ribosome biogenesis GTPase Der [Candidatus Eremiobacteraeota bacterium]|nr:ribosome biogenesis GTPase Der [Candidatus Eremiobacteraeota bacterium]